MYLKNQAFVCQIYTINLLYGNVIRTLTLQGSHVVRDSSLGVHVWLVF